MADSVIIESGIPIPALYSYRHPMSAEERRARNRSAAKIQRNRRVARGLCGWFGCPEKFKEGHTLCESHLEHLRQDARQRDEERKAKGLCHDCGKRPRFSGLVLCLFCQQRQGRGLPKAVKKGLAEFKRREKEEEREAEREEMRGKLHLLDERRRYIISLRNGLDDGRERTLQEVGDLLGLTRERIRQLEETAMYKIDKDIPIPTGGKRGEAAMTLQAMEVGDSFTCDENQLSSVRLQASRLEYIITTRRQSGGQFRVWMVSKNGASG